VTGDPATESMGLDHERLELFVGVVEPGVEFAVLAVVVAAVDVNFDPVGAATDLLPNRFADLVGAVGVLHPPGKWDLPGEAARRVFPSRGEGARRNVHSRAPDDPAGDRLFQVDVGVHRPFGADVTDGREALVECSLRCRGRADGAIGDRLAQQLVVPFG